MLIGLQTFTIRKMFQTEAEIDHTLSSLKKLGINYLELAYYPFKLTKIMTLKKYLDKYQIQVISSQIKYKTIVRNFSEIIKIHQVLNIKYMAISVIPFKRLFMGNYGIKKLANELNNLGDKVKQYQIQLLFHHHNYEFIKFNKVMAFDILLSNLDNEKVQILSDTYWVKKGGFDCLDFITKYRRFVKALHIRGYKKRSDSNLLENEIDFSQIIAYARKNNFYYGVIEQNTDFVFSELKKSIQLINELDFQDLLKVKSS